MIPQEFNGFSYNFKGIGANYYNHCLFWWWYFILLGLLNDVPFLNVELVRLEQIIEKFILNRSLLRRVGLLSVEFEREFWQWQVLERTQLQAGVIGRRIVSDANERLDYVPVVEELQDQLVENEEKRLREDFLIVLVLVEVEGLHLAHQVLLELAQVLLNVPFPAIE